MCIFLIEFKLFCLSSGIQCADESVTRVTASGAGVTGADQQ